MTHGQVTKLAVMSFAAVHLTTAAHATLYECSAVNVGVMTPKGLIIITDPDQHYKGSFLTVYQGFLFDAETGVLRTKRGSPLEYEVMNRGDAKTGHDVLAVGKWRQTAVRIRVWEPGMPFVYEDAGSYFAGACKLWGK
jgi:hypothetical protein